jgi:hypothetical protein
VRDFACPHCGQRLAFENSVCLSCCNGIGFDLDLMEFAEVGRHGRTVAPPRRQMCANLSTAGCTWVTAEAAGSAVPRLCRSCSLTRTRPADEHDVPVSTR